MRSLSFHSMALLHGRKCEQLDSYVCIFGNDGRTQSVSGELQMYINKCTQTCVCVFCVWRVVLESALSSGKRTSQLIGSPHSACHPTSACLSLKLTSKRPWFKWTAACKVCCFLNADSTVISFCRDVERKRKGFDSCLPLG